MFYHITKIFALEIFIPAFDDFRHYTSTACFYAGKTSEIPLNSAFDDPNHYLSVIRLDHKMPFVEYNF